MSFRVPALSLSGCVSTCSGPNRTGDSQIDCFDVTRLQAARLMDSHWARGSRCRSSARARLQFDSAAAVASDVRSLEDPPDRRQRHSGGEETPLTDATHERPSRRRLPVRRLMMHGSRPEPAAGSRETTQIETPSQCEPPETLPVSGSQSSGAIIIILNVSARCISLSAPDKHIEIVNCDIVCAGRSTLNTEHFPRQRPLRRRRLAEQLSTFLILISSRAAQLQPVGHCGAP